MFERYVQKNQDLWELFAWSDWTMQWEVIYRSTNLHQVLWWKWNGWKG